MKISRVHAKNTTLGIGLLLCTLALSGFGYPNDGTVIIGPDIREGANGLYEIFLETPRSVAPGETFTVKATIEFTKDFLGASIGSVNITGGSLQNEQSQDLKPSTTWNMQAQPGSLIGIVISTQTKIAPKDKPQSETTYWDTISTSVPVVSEVRQDSQTISQHDLAKAFETGSNTILFSGIALVVFVIGLGIFWRKRHKRSPRNH